ncbi:MAG: guanylate kinase [Bacteroidales bacterium]|nr:guanylate kinase [Bacteroidales bacterium]
MTGKLIIFSAPSGSGKTTILKEILKQRNDLEFSISACSRAPRGKEEDGKDYYFLSVADFKQRIHKNQFVEWEEVYDNRFYGTLKSELDRIWSEGKHVVFDVDVVGGLNIKKMYGDQALSIFIQAPSVEILKERLIGRNTEDEENLLLRLNKADEEMSYAPNFDKIIVNDILEDAVQNTHQVIQDFIDQ